MRFANQINAMVANSKEINSQLTLLGTKFDEFQKNVGLWLWDRSNILWYQFYNIVKNNFYLVLIIIYERDKQSSEIIAKN